MNIQITSRKFRAKDSLKIFIKDEIKALEKFNDQILDVNVVLSFTHPKDSIKIAEVIVKLPGKSITIENSSDTFEKSVISAIEKIKTQLKKIKTKRIVRSTNED
jgi:ribosomal subunit interface protein